MPNGRNPNGALSKLLKRKQFNSKSDFCPEVLKMNKHNFDQARVNFLELAGGDPERAFDLAVMAYIEAWEDVSPGYRREPPCTSIERGPKPRPAPILTELGK